MQNTDTTLPLRLWTVEEYHRMAAAGIFAVNQRVELLEGKIIWMIAKGTAHRSAVGRTDYLLKNRLANLAWVSIQDPIHLNEMSEPEPDIAVVKVADSSLKIDCDTKAKAYSQAGITDYWVLDVTSRQLHVFREPTHSEYESAVILAEDATISPLAFPDLQIVVLEMLPPVK